LMWSKRCYQCPMRPHGWLTSDAPTPNSAASRLGSPPSSARRGRRDADKAVAVGLAMTALSLAAPRLELLARRCSSPSLSPRALCSGGHDRTPRQPSRPAVPRTAQDRVWRARVRGSRSAWSVGGPMAACGNGGAKTRPTGSKDPAIRLVGR
jgi:hypothetical protein